MRKDNAGLVKTKVSYTGEVILYTALIVRKAEDVVT